MMQYLYSQIYGRRECEAKVKEEEEEMVKIVKVVGMMLGMIVRTSSL